jgi:hypothetical protein
MVLTATFEVEVWKIQVEVFWVVTTCNVVVGYQRFGGPFCLHLQGEDGGSTVFWNACVVPRHYMASQPRRPRTETLPSRKPPNSTKLRLSLCTLYSFMTLQNKWMELNVCNPRRSVRVTTCTQPVSWRVTIKGADTIGTLHIYIAGTLRNHVLKPRFWLNVELR